MDSNEILEKILSPDESVRKEAIDAFQEIPPADLTPDIDKYLDIIPKSDDPYALLQVSMGLSSALTSNPAATDQHIPKIKSALEYLATQDLSDEGYLGSVALYLIQPVTPKFQTNTELLKEWLDVLFKLINSPGSVKHTASAPIVTMSMQNPVILKDHVDQIFDAIDGGFQSLSSSLFNLYNFNPEAFEKRMDWLINKYQTDIQFQSLYLMTISEVAKKKPELMVPHVGIFATGLSNPSLAASIMMLFTEVASHDANSLYPFVNQFVQAVTFNPNLAYQVPNILSLIGRTSDDRAKEVLPHLFTMMNTSNDMAKGMILGEIRNLGEMNKSLMDPYIEQVRGYEESPQETIRDQAKMIVDFYEGKDIRSLANVIDEQNQKIAESCKSVEEVMAYVDENIETLKEFIADIAKKIPTPTEFSTEGRIRKTILLHFVCDKQGDRCIFPPDRTFTTESKDFAKWLKIGFSAVKIGKAIISPAKIGDAGKAVKEAYDAYRDKDDKDYLAYISQPFLTSQEQDHLINQLRDAKFFDVFTYDAQIAGWNCTMCNL